jgi:hypothetical protein
MSCRRRKASERNIKRMLAFYRLYSEAAQDTVLDAELVPRPVAQAGALPDGAVDLPPAAQDFPAGLLLACPGASTPC